MHDIRIKDLDIWFDTSLGKVSAVRGLSADFRAGHISGVIGESGSGKSVMGLSILRLLPETAHISGQCLYGEQDLYALPLRQLRALRGSEIGLIPQNPSASMNPVIKLRRQMTEAMAVHGGASGKKAARLAAGMLEQFGFQNPDNILKSFSFQMSGGMNQRLVSALALMCRPGWIIADEPTKGLDAILRRQVYSVMRQICTPERGMIVITHDLQLAGKLCHDLRVMYMGQIVEQGPAGDVTAWPRHPYTQGLIGAMVQNGLKPIPFPDKDKTGGGGCAFYPRCPKAMPRCRDEIPNDYPTGPDAKVKCFLYA